MEQLIYSATPIGWLQNLVNIAFELLFIIVPIFIYKVRGKEFQNNKQVKIFFKISMPFFILASFYGINTEYKNADSINKALKSNAKNKFIEGKVKDYFCKEG